MNSWPVSCVPFTSSFIWSLDMYYRLLVPGSGSSLKLEFAYLIDVGSGTGDHSG